MMDREEARKYIKDQLARAGDGATVLLPHGMQHGAAMKLFDEVKAEVAREQTQAHLNERWSAQIAAQGEGEALPPPGEEVQRRWADTIVPPAPGWTDQQDEQDRLIDEALNEELDTMQAQPVPETPEEQAQRYWGQIEQLNTENDQHVAEKAELRGTVNEQAQALGKERKAVDWLTGRLIELMGRFVAAKVANGDMLPENYEVRRRGDADGVREAVRALRA